jgi:hypothetical protein
VQLPKQLPKRKSPVQRLRSTVTEAASNAVKNSPVRLPKPSRRTVKAGLLTLGGLTGLTAASAGISAHRDRREEADDDS